MTYVHRTSFEPRAQRSVLFAKQTGRAMTSLVKEQLLRLGTRLRRGGAVAEPWPEENRLWPWRLMRKWMRTKKRKTIDCRLGQYSRPTTSIQNLRQFSTICGFPLLVPTDAVNECITKLRATSPAIHTDIGRTGLRQESLQNKSLLKQAKLRIPKVRYVGTMVSPTMAY